MLASVCFLKYPSKVLCKVLRTFVDIILLDVRSVLLLNENRKCGGFVGNIIVVIERRLNDLSLSKFGLLAGRSLGNALMNNFPS